MIIDIHAHCFPDALAKKAMKILSAAGGNLPYYTGGTVGGLKRSMDEAGIDISVIQNIATKPSQTTAVNRWAAETKNERIVSFGSIHPDFERWADEIKFFCDAGIKGIKFHPDYQDFYVAEKRLYPIYEAAANAGLVILFHAGLDLGYPPPYKCMPDKLAIVLEDFRGAKIIAAHMGAYDYWDDVEKYLLGKALYLDTSYCLMGMSGERLLSLIKSHGADKVLFGTDSPWLDQKTEVENIRALGLAKAEEEAVFYNNAKRLLEL